MKFINWIKRKLAIFLLAMSKVEKDAFSQKHNIDSGQGINQNLRQDNLADDLIKGEVTQEVKNLRWRTYKVLQHSRGFKNFLDTDTGKIKSKKITTNLKKIKLDNDLYPLEILFKNNKNTLTINESLEDFTGKINIEKLNSSIKPKSYLSVFRESPANYKIEDYSEKLHIRKYSDDKKLIEFYVSKYADNFNRKSIMFVNKMEKLKKEKITQDNILNIKEVRFSSFETLGCEDFNEFLYKIEKFDSIVEYNASYVIKFIGNVIFENKYMLSDFVEDDLEYKYQNIEMKNNDNTIYFDNINTNN